MTQQEQWTANFSKRETIQLRNTGYTFFENIFILILNISHLIDYSLKRIFSGYRKEIDYSVSTKTAINAKREHFLVCNVKQPCTTVSAVSV